MSQFLGSEELYIAFSSETLCVAISGPGGTVCRTSWVGSCMSQFVGSVQLYVAIPGLGGTVCRNSWSGRSCMLQFLDSEELYDAIPVCSCLRRSRALASMLRLKLYPRRSVVS